MTTCYRCKRDFEPPMKYPRRRICERCLDQRPRHLREQADIEASDAAKRGNLPSVSVGIDPIRAHARAYVAAWFERERERERAIARESMRRRALAEQQQRANAEWRRKNVLPFKPRAKPPTSWRQVMHSLIR